MEHPILSSALKRRYGLSAAAGNGVHIAFQAPDRELSGVSTSLP